eukprot:gene11330-13389_t
MNPLDEQDIDFKIVTGSTEVKHRADDAVAKHMRSYSINSRAQPAVSYRLLFIAVLMFGSGILAVTYKFNARPPMYAAVGETFADKEAKSVKAFMAADTNQDGRLSKSEVFSFSNLWKPKMVNDTEDSNSTSLASAAVDGLVSAADFLVDAAVDGVNLLVGDAEEEAETPAPAPQPSVASPEPQPAAAQGPGSAPSSPPSPGAQRPSTPTPKGQQKSAPEGGPNGGTPAASAGVNKKAASSPAGPQVKPEAAAPEAYDDTVYPEGGAAEVAESQGSPEAAPSTTEGSPGEAEGGGLMQSATEGLQSLLGMTSPSGAAASAPESAAEPDGTLSGYVKSAVGTIGSLMGASEEGDAQTGVASPGAAPAEPEGGIEDRLSGVVDGVRSMIGSLGETLGAGEGTESEGAASSGEGAEDGQEPAPAEDARASKLDASGHTGKKNGNQPAAKGNSGTAGAGGPAGPDGAGGEQADGKTDEGGAAAGA